MGLFKALRKAKRGGDEPSGAGKTERRASVGSSTSSTRRLSVSGLNNLEESQDEDCSAPSEVKAKMAKVASRASLKIDSITDQAKSQHKDRNALVLGGAESVGLHIAIGLAARGFRVVICCETEGIGQAAIAQVKGAVPGDPKVGFLLAPMESFSQLMDAIDLFDDSYSSLHLIVFANHKHELALSARETTVDGRESLLQANALSPLLVLNRLAPLMEKTGEVDGYARVVFIASNRPGDDFNFADIDSQKWSRGAAKANYNCALYAIFTHMAAKSPKTLSVTMVDPVVREEGAGVKGAPVHKKLHAKLSGRSADEVSDAVLLVVDDRSFQRKTGQYVKDGRPMFLKGPRGNPALSERIYTACAKLVPTSKESFYVPPVPAVPRKKEKEPERRPSPEEVAAAAAEQERLAREREAELEAAAAKRREELAAKRAAAAERAAEAEAEAIRQAELAHALRGEAANGFDAATAASADLSSKAGFGPRKKKEKKPEKPHVMTGKTICVIGGCSDPAGLSISLKYARLGCRVIFDVPNETTGIAALNFFTEQGIGEELVFFFEVDLESTQSIASAMYKFKMRFKSLNLLLFAHNVHPSSFVVRTESTDHPREIAFRNNVLTPMHVTKELAPLLEETAAATGYGRILFICANVSKDVCHVDDFDLHTWSAEKSHSHYRAALYHFNTYLAKECPPALVTAIIDHHRHTKDPKTMKGTSARGTPPLKSGQTYESELQHLVAAVCKVIDKDSLRRTGQMWNDNGSAVPVRGKKGEYLASLKIYEACMALIGVAPAISWCGVGPHDESRVARWAWEAQRLMGVEGHVEIVHDHEEVDEEDRSSAAGSHVTAESLRLEDYNLPELDLGAKAT